MHCKIVLINCIDNIVCEPIQAATYAHYNMYQYCMALHDEDIMFETCSPITFGELPSGSAFHERNLAARIGTHNKCTSQGK